MKTQSANNLFTPVQVGSMQLKHRVVMAPLARSRSVQPGSIPGDLMLEYYAQRASEGGLIVSEATPISGGGWFGAPGLYSDALYDYGDFGCFRLHTVDEGSRKGGFKLSKRRIQ
jgi:N-ethylmaleimide reductase